MNKVLSDWYFFAQPVEENKLNFIAIFWPW